MSNSMFGYWDKFQSELNLSILISSRCGVEFYY